MCYAGRLKGSMYLVNARLVVRNAANSLQIEGKGVLPVDPTRGGRNTEHETIYIYMYIYISTINHS